MPAGSADRMVGTQGGYLCFCDKQFPKDCLFHRPRKPDIQVLIQKRLAEMKISADEVLLLLADQARASIKPFIKVTDEGFVYFDFSQPEALEHLYLIKKIKSKRSRRIEGRGDMAEQWGG